MPKSKSSTKVTARRTAAKGSRKGPAEPTAGSRCLVPKLAEERQTRAIMTRTAAIVSASKGATPCTGPGACATGIMRAARTAARV